MLYYVHLLLFLVGAFPPLFKHIFFSAISFSRTFSFTIRPTIFLELGFVFSGTQWNRALFIHGFYIVPASINRKTIHLPLTLRRHSLNMNKLTLSIHRKKLSKTPSFHLKILVQVLLGHGSRSPKMEEKLCSQFCHFIQRCSFPWLLNLDNRI